MIQTLLTTLFQKCQSSQRMTLENWKWKCWIENVKCEIRCSYKTGTRQGETDIKNMRRPTLNCINFIIMYVGLDFSWKVIKTCIYKYQKDKNNGFIYYGQSLYLYKLIGFKSELNMSFNILYHLIEDSVFYKYLLNLL